MSSMVLEIFIHGLAKEFFKRRAHEVYIVAKRGKEFRTKKCEGVYFKSLQGHRNNTLDLFSSVVKLVRLRPER